MRDHLVNNKKSGVKAGFFFEDVEVMINNEAQSRFELKIENEVVFATYRLDNKTLYINYVEAPQSLRGTGAAGKLMQQILEWAKEKDYKVFPICGYAVSWINRHSEYHSLRA